MERVLASLHRDAVARVRWNRHQSPNNRDSRRPVVALSIRATRATRARGATTQVFERLARYGKGAEVISASRRRSEGEGGDEDFEDFDEAVEEEDAAGGSVASEVRGERRRQWRKFLQRQAAYDAKKARGIDGMRAFPRLFFLFKTQRQKPHSHVVEMGERRETTRPGRANDTLGATGTCRRSSRSWWQRPWTRTSAATLCSGSRRVFHRPDDTARDVRFYVGGFSRIGS